MHKKILFLLILSYSLTASWLSILRFNAFNAGFIDLGRMEQALWNTINGNPLVNTFEFGNAPRFIVHCEPILILLSWFYLFFKRAEFLLIVQSLLLGLAALPLYQIAKLELKSEGLALILSLCYLLYPALLYINLADFHPDTIAIIVIFFAFYFMLVSRWMWFWIMIAFLLSIREYYGLVVSFWGAYLFFQYKDKKRAAILIFLGGGWFLFSYFAFPRLFLEYHLWNDLIGPLSGSSFGLKLSLIKDIAALLVPVAFLPLLKPIRLLAVLPIFLGAVLVGQFSYANHHTASLIPFIFLATILAIKGLSSIRIEQFGFLLVLATLFANQLYGGGPASVRFYLPQDYHYWKNEHNFYITKHDYILSKFVKLIPDNASVSASNHIGAHLSRRKYINYFPYPEDFASIDYILADLSKPLTMPWLLWDKQVEKVDKLKVASRFILLKKEDGVYLFRRKSAS